MLGSVYDSLLKIRIDKAQIYLDNQPDLHMIEATKS